MKKSAWWWAANLLGLVALLVLLIISRTQYNNLQDELDTAENQNSSLSSQLTQAQSDLGNLQAVFPPGEFASPAELQAWLDANPISEQPTTTYAAWYSNALQLQQDALMDGYIISVDFDYDGFEGIIFINCQTVIDGWIWYWDPETDDIIKYDYFGPVN